MMIMSCLSGLTGKYFNSYKKFAKDESKSVFTRLEEKLRRSR